jgi:hypothetical protein
LYLDAGFEKFARTHNIEVRCLLLWRYKGDGDMTVGVFDDSSCRMHYHSDHFGECNVGQL